MFPARLNEEKKSGGEKTTAPSLLFLSSLRVAFSHVVVVVELSRYRFRISELRCEGKLERIHFFFSFRSRTKRRFQRRSRISIIMREALSSSLSSRALLPFISCVSWRERKKKSVRFTSIIHQGYFERGCYANRSSSRLESCIQKGWNRRGSCIWKFNSIDPRLLTIQARIIGITELS